MRSLRESQNDRLLKLLQRAGDAGISLPRILDMRIANYSARISDLRLLGFKIECSRERVERTYPNGQTYWETHTKYTLTGKQSGV
jgi:hypothetical protein